MPIVKAALVIAKDSAGQNVYLYQGTEAPASIPAEELERLADFFEDAPVVAEVFAEAERPAESGPGSSKAKWIEYAGTHGVDVDPEGSKEDIIAAVSAAGH